MPKTPRQNLRDQDQPTPQPEQLQEEEPLMVDLPGFQSPPPAGPSPEQLQELAGAIVEGAELGADFGTGSGDAGDRSTQTTTGSFPASTSPGPSPALPGFEEIARTVVAVVAMGVRWFRQRTAPIALPPQLWLATEDDQEAIGGPLARITARHAPISGEGTEDVADGIAAVMGGVGYAVRNLQLEDLVRQTGPVVLENGQHEDPQG